MSIAYGPYKAEIPFVNIQQATLQNIAQNRLMVELVISNETGAPRNGMQFGNLVMFFTTKNAVDTLASSPRNLKSIIRNPPPTSRLQNFSLNMKDFSLKAYADSSGKEKIYNHTHTKQFAVNPPSNLYVLVVSYRQYKNKIFLGNVSKETIIENGIAPLHSNVYFLNETVDNYGTANSVWPGSVHRHGTQLMAGNMHLSIQHPTVRQEVVQNYKIKDLRFLSAAATLDFSNFVMTSNTEAIFSDATLSRNDEGDIHGTLSFDMLKYARQNARFGGLVTNNKALLSMSILEDIILYRKVVNVASAGNALTPGRARQCGLKETDQFQQVATLGDGVDVLTIAASNNDGILSISFVDDGTQDIASGAVEYKIEMVINDKTSEAIKGFRDTLMTQLKNYRPETRENWDTLITNYLSVINFIFGNSPFEKYSLLVWKKNLIALVNSPQTRKTDRQKVINTIQLFIDSLSGLLETPVAIGSTPFNVDSKIYNSTRDPLNRIVQILKNKYTITDKKRVGLGYLDRALKNKKTTMPSIGSRDLLTRANQEVSKYAVGNPGAATINPFGYLSPEVVSLGEVEVETPTLSVPEDQLTELLRSNAQGRNFVANELQKSAPLNKSEVLNSLGMGARPLTVPLRKLSVAAVQGDDSVDSEFYFSPTSRFVRDNTHRTGESGSSDSIVEKNQQLDALFNSDLVNMVVDQTSVGFKDNIDLTNKRIVETSLALRKFEEGGDPITELSSVSNVINFNSLARVEYLESYDANLRCGKLNWKTLDEATWQAATNNDASLLCRLVRITNTLDVKDTLGLHPMGSLFTLGSPGKETNGPNHNRVFATIRSTITGLGTNNMPAPINITIYYSRNVPIISTPARQTEAQLSPTTKSRISSLARRGLGY